MPMKIQMLSEQAYVLSGLSIKDVLEQKFCVFDLEATNDQVENAEVMGIGAVRMDSTGIQEEQTFHTYIKPSGPIPQPIATSTGIYNADVEGSPRFPKGYGMFTDFANECVFVTYGGYEFDLPLLQRDCGRHGLPEPANPCIDIKAMFAGLHPEVEDEITMEMMIDYYGLKTTSHTGGNTLGNYMLIGHIWMDMMQELKARSIQHLEYPEPLIVKRFQHPSKRSVDTGSRKLRFPALTDSQRKVMLSILVLFFLTMTLTGMVDLFTFRLRWNGGLSGNGNPALLIVFLLVPLYTVLLCLTGAASCYFFREKMRDGWYSGGMLSCLVVMTGTISWLAVGYYYRIFHDLVGATSESGSTIFRFGEWDQYSNTAFINILTYSLGISLSLLIGYGIAFLTRKQRG
ncbi:hypothetical protein GCM10008915_34270 [Bifidobacterium pullorum subsp. gallinarum]